MADAVAEGGDAPAKRSKRPLIAGLALALLLGAGGFWAAYSGMIPAGASRGHETAGHAGATDPDIAFVALPALVISLPAGANARHLRFTGQVEVAQDAAEGVAALTPRILDVLNSYLRAVDTRDIEDPAALARLRAQMLRRVQLVTGDGRVRDLLITEFVLN